MVSICYLSFLILSLFAALSDFLFYRIPNALILVLLIGTGLKLFLEYPSLDYYLTGLIFMTIFLVGYLLYAFKIMGAGDAKLLSVSILWIAPREVVTYLITVAIAGGFIGILYIFLHNKIDAVRLKLIEKLKQSSFFNQHWLVKNYLQAPFTPANNQNTWAKISLPYGIPIFIGNLIFVSFTIMYRGFQ